MPNWCENRVYLEASPAEIEAIISAIQSDGDSGLLNHLRPQPEYELEAVVTGELPRWYAWRIENWGTKWEVSAEVVSHSVSDGWINLAFDSAWSPPLEAFYFWEAQSPETRNFNIRYVEWGSDTCGEADSRGINETYYIPATAADVKEMIPIDIDEEFGISDNVAQWESEEAEA
jgi:hypothetical protein